MNSCHLLALVIPLLNNFRKELREGEEDAKCQEICLFLESMCFIFSAPAKHKTENTSVKSVEETPLSHWQLSFFLSTLDCKRQVN